MGLNEGMVGYGTQMKKITSLLLCVGEKKFFKGKMNRETWHAAIHGVTKSQTQLND